ncbi:MAG: LysR family transcriptional regulator [Tabrizicola sp.]|uniref:LysR family transcriptional regulator n=1 Tax=Tabrizicola sp. TaxID=2005166 RepID=UPI00273705F9|nr:LysR family transcriptional regulator [Tabrizicola sp.]MDP3263576.1 LysR family transcriptional regulator [Tabrizicola sp.]MDP3649767.1 LysR family transcriptional regulator [Paracoccaceae bacterium]
MPLRFTLRQLEYLVAVGEAGSIAVAAERVNVSSPSISAAIAQLEQEFGLQLFIRRHAQGLALTQGGRQFAAEARAVLAAAGRLSDLANSITGQVRGRVALGCLVTFAQMVLPRVRRSFCDLHPDVEFQQFELDQAEIFAGLRAARLDVALTYELDIPPDLSFVPLLRLAPHAVLPFGHPLAGCGFVTPADLAPLPMILLDLPFSTDYFLDLFRPTGVRPKIVERTRDLGVVRSMVANGFGYSIANIRPASAAAPDGTPLSFVPLRGPEPLALGLVLAEGAQSALTIRAFVEHCRATVTEATLPGLVIGGG